MRYQFASRFAPGDRVIIDGDGSIEAYISTVGFRGNAKHQVVYELGWFTNGTERLTYRDGVR